MNSPVAVAPSPAASFVTKYAPTFEALKGSLAPTEPGVVTATFADPVDAVLAKHTLNSAIDGVNLLIAPDAPESVLQESGRWTNWSEAEFVGQIPGVTPTVASRSGGRSGVSVESQEQLDLLRPLIVESETGPYSISMRVAPPQA